MMTKNAVIVTLVLATATVTPLVAWADTPAPGNIPSLLHEKGCTLCHGMTEMRIGPPFKAVAARYAHSGSWRIKVLALKIVNGGAGNWGVIAMPPNRVTLGQARTIVHWILRAKFKPARKTRKAPVPKVGGAD